MRRDLLVALCALLVVSAWLAFGARLQPAVPPTPDAARFEWILGVEKVPVELRAVDAGYEYRPLAGPHAGEWLSATRFQELVAEAAQQRQGRAWLLRLFNASGWGSLAWVGLGLAGQLCFFGRMLVQWLASERQGVSIVPPVFWWLSLAGSACLLTYFVWRIDAVGVLGQSTGSFVYARNLWLIRRREREETAAPARPAQGVASLR